MNHEKAVRKYFDSAVFNEETISMLMVEFYSSDLPKKKSKYSHKVLSNTQTTNQNRTFSQKLNKESIVVIVELLNELNLFYEHLDADEVWIRYKEDRLSTVTCRHQHSSCPCSRQTCFKQNHSSALAKYHFGKKAYHQFGTKKTSRPA